MDQSAESPRERRKRETSRALTDAARRLTTDHGFAGFTIEELCGEVGVSRRTFFNYFESKEHAVFGFTAIDPRQEELEAAFVAGSGELLDDFVDLVIARFDLHSPLDHAPALFAIIEQEPRLIKAAFELMSANERRDMHLIMQRDGADADAELRAEVLVQSVGALMRLSMDRLLHHHSTESFTDLLTRRLAVARAAFGTAQKAD